MITVLLMTRDFFVYCSLKADQKLSFIILVYDNYSVLIQVYRNSSYNAYFSSRHVTKVSVLCIRVHDTILTTGPMFNVTNVREMTNAISD